MTILDCRLELLSCSPRGGPGVWLCHPRRLWPRVEILPWLENSKHSLFGKIRDRWMPCLCLSTHGGLPYAASRGMLVGGHCWRFQPWVTHPYVHGHCLLNAPLASWPQDQNKCPSSPTCHLLMADLHSFPSLGPSCWDYQYS